MGDQQDEIDLVVFIHFADMRRGLCADQQVVMREHHAFRGSRRSRGVDQHRDLFRRVFLDRFCNVADVQPADADALQRTELTGLRTTALRMSRRFLRNFRGEKHPPRAAVIANLVQLAR